jgi:CRISPR-associated exonuclease Cas4
MRDEPYILISALNHYAYCPRRCFLIHSEGLFDENAYTLEGHLLHDRVDTGRRTIREGVVEHRRVPLVSHTLRLEGVADLVEERNGTVLPIEYKRGARGRWDNDRIQLCAQALCLEEMLGNVAVTEGAIYYATTGRRQSVALTTSLREQTLATLSGIRQLLVSGRDPGAVPKPQCRGCSLDSICLPTETERYRSIDVTTFEGDDEV